MFKISRWGHKKVRAIIIAMFMVSAGSTYGQTISFQYMGNGPKSAVVIHVVKQDGGVGSGTAFQVVYSTAAHGDEYRFLVTARHVIEGAQAAQVLFKRFSH